jgi:uncharacterized protein YfaS (alpha-2-macroglobulin family)
LYTLALADVPDLASMNRLREQNNLSDDAKWRLAATYRIIGKKEVAEELISGLSTEVKSYREHSGSFGSSLRDKAMILETLSLLDQRTNAFPLVQEISKKLSSDSWMSTQTTAYCLVAMAEFAGGETPGQMSFSYTVNGKSEEMISYSPVKQIPIDVLGAPKVKVENLSEGVLYVRVVASGIPVAGDNTAVEKNLKLRIVYKDMQGNVVDVSKLQQGTDFKAEVTIENSSVNKYEQMALTQIFPSGWEILNTRFGEVDQVNENDMPDYQDIRDDRVYSYFGLDKYKDKTFTIFLTAAYVGKYYLPTISCEAMYDNNINARKPGQWVEVVK